MIAMVAGRSKSRPARLTPDDWIQAAIDEVREERGVHGIRIARLARRLGVTPGSFYWHFESRQQLRDRVLRHWMAMMSRTDVKEGRRGVAALRALPLTLAKMRLPELDVAMRAWARKDPAVAAAVKKADDVRIGRLEGMFQAAGIGEKSSALRARALFWIHLGSHGAPPDQRAGVFLEATEALLASGSARTNPAKAHRARAGSPS